MKHTVKRSFSILLAFVLCLNLLSGLTLKVDAASWIPNWGSRGTTATYLSQNAESFYAKNGVTYEALAALPGGSTVDAVPGSALYDALEELMVSNHTNINTYNESRSMFCYTDCQNGDYTTSGAISSFYSGKAIGPEWDGGATWNREHTWPNSKSTGGSKNTSDREEDIMMLRPTAASENTSRGNTAYGESAGYYHPNSTSGGALDVRGDVARTILYVYVRWGDFDGALDYMWGSDGAIESKEVLLKWMEQDPVDTWELGRNDSVESITGTRNVFVDYPELAFLLFNEAVPANMTTPSGKAASSAYTITATVNNSSYGSVTVSGRNITAVPAPGYQVAGYTLESGTATVQRNGNVFVVTASSDCSICIHFQEASNVTVYYSENGVVTSSADVLSGNSVTLPSNTTKPPEGCSFRGWVTYSIIESDRTPAAILLPGQKYTVEESMTFYALYSKAADSETSETGEFNLFSGTLTEGDYLIVYNNGAMKAEPTSAGRINYADMGSIGQTISNPDAMTVWHIAPTSDGYWYIYNEETGTYASSTQDTKNKAQLDAELSDRGKWTVSGSGTYEFVNLANFSAGINSNLRRNDQYGFACYSTATGGALTLYKSTGSFIYTTGGEPVDSPIDPPVVIPYEIELNAEELGGAASVWLDGREYPVLTDGERVYVAFDEGTDPATLVTYTYYVGDESDVHTQYPTGMQVWSVHLTDTAYVAEREEGLDNLLQYSGCSIRITGKKGIRMITSVNKNTKAALTGKGINGYTLLEYGTLLGWASELDDENALVLGKSYAKSNYAYKKGVADPVFATTGDLVQYTNVLVGFTNDQCKDDIAMRPYIILQDEDGGQITIYGGVIYRSIGYIAYQNRTVFTPGTNAYNFVWEIIHHVYGDQYDADYKG